MKRALIGLFFIVVCLMAQSALILKGGDAWADADAGPLLHAYRSSHGYDRTDVVGWQQINKTEATAMNAQLVAASINKVVWYFGQRQ